MFNNICIDVDYSQLYKDGQRIGGDVFLLNRNSDKNRICATLSDGLGSGVRANVLASLTAHMGQQMSFSPMALAHSAEIIMDTLPVDSEKGISYSTFTIAQIVYSPGKDNIEVSLVEYDNPDSLRFEGSTPIEWDKTAHKLHRKTAIKDETVLSSYFKMKIGDRLIYFSDGVVQAGVGLGTINTDAVSSSDSGMRTAEGTSFKAQYSVPSTQSSIISRKNSNVSSKGWGIENVKEFITDTLNEDPEISSRDLSRAIVTKAYSYDNYHPNDDITCVVVHIRKPRRTLIVTGAPHSREFDKELARRVATFDGNVIVAGGTTAQIVARELGTVVMPDKSPSGDLPPASIIEGVTLTTEGMLTLTRATERLSNKVLLKHMPEDPAKEVIKIMRQTDQVEIIVGTKINDDVDDPNLAVNIGVRIPMIERLKKALEENYLKEVEVHYV